MKLLIIILFMAYVLIKLFKVAVRKINFSSPFSGDYRDVDPNLMGSVNEFSLLNGDIDDDDADDDDSTGDPLGDLIGDVIAMSNETDPNDFISGDLDSEYKNAQFTPADFGYGGIFSKLKSKKKKEAAKKGQKVSTASLVNLAKSAQAQMSTADKVGLKPNLVLNKLASNVLKSGKDLSTIEKDLNAAKLIAGTPGGATSKFDFARIFVTGGMIKITETNLKIPGAILAETNSFWKINYPGLSRSMTINAPANGTVTFSFVEPTAQQITKVFAIFIMLNAPILTEVQNAEIGLRVTGVLNNGGSLNYTKDRIALFTNPNDRSCLIGILPTVEIKQSLYTIPLATPSTADPLVVELTGVPEKTSCVCRLAGLDSSEYLAYERMVGLK